MCPIVAGSISDVDLVGAVRVHHVELIIAVSVGPECDLVAVRGPRGKPKGVRANGGVVSKTGLASTIGVHYVDILVARSFERRTTGRSAWRVSSGDEGDLAPVGGPGGIYVVDTGDDLLIWFTDQAVGRWRRIRLPSRQLDDATGSGGRAWESARQVEVTARVTIQPQPGIWCLAPGEHLTS